MKEYIVIYEWGSKNWSAYVPDLPGCVSAGFTLEETKRNIREAMEGHLEVMREYGEPIPEPTSEVERVAVLV
jgi:predicted RNase H-like HicB family nuclease